ncbi:MULTISPECIES: hypothetical protein [Flavobacteriaceae]|uniref:HNH endonuclease n=2 Tax=Flavobacteriaceae TaxID=49546 RepID=A0A4Y8ARJ3_9FLAO|nr:MULTISPECIES: hypothetical protein [Flavobacteriaceae]TEW73827.1 hypothetical protein E2488_10125 [Gramella jeungdoensis]GGK37920.1 hypothetical protein GCM10007963_02560 [Lutibacter litoralis]
MLRSYTPINHPIFTLHPQLEHLVCQVWCNASDNNTCQELLQEDFEIIYNAYGWLKTAIDDIYENCKELTDDQRADIREAYIINNRLEELCNGDLVPINLDQLHSVVETSMKPLLVKFYDYLLDLATVAGNKLDYYNKLIIRNRFNNCPCCGLTPIESAETHYREDNDHYLPKADFPFASVNFKNLVPLCGKCNKKYKSTKNPFEDGRVSFYPFDTNHQGVEIKTTIVNSETLDYRALTVKDIVIDFDNNANKVDTWNWLFGIKTRYNKEIRDFSKTELRIIKNRLFKNSQRKGGLTYEEILEDRIEEYGFEKFEDRKFLKIPFLQEIRRSPDWMAVYNDL